MLLLTILFFTTILWEISQNFELKTSKFEFQSQHFEVKVNYLIYQRQNSEIKSWNFKINRQSYGANVGILPFISNFLTLYVQKETKHKPKKPGEMSTKPDFILIYQPAEIGYNALVMLPLYTFFSSNREGVFYINVWVFRISSPFYLINPAQRLLC